MAKELKRVVSSDSNVSCVNAAIDCVDVLARGLRKSFRAPAKLLFPVLLEKYKEKSAAVTRSIHKSLGSVMEMSVSVADVKEDLVKNIKHKNPKNKVETLKFCCAALRVSREASSVAKVHDTVLKEARRPRRTSPDVREATPARDRVRQMRAGPTPSSPTRPDRQREDVQDMRPCRAAAERRSQSQ